MKGRAPRVPSRFRTVALLVVLLALHVLAPDRVERIRLGLLRGVVGPVASWGTLGTTDSAPPVPAAVADRLVALEAETRAPYRDLPYPPLAVLDVDLESGWLVAGGGFEVGVQRGASALLPEGYIGVVDSVLPHLARVRLLGAPGTRLAVRARTGSTAEEGHLPGSLEGLFAVLEGHEGGLVLTSSQLPDAFRVGDRLHTLDANGAGGWPVGQVISSGPLPSVRLDASPVGASLVAIEGPDREVTRSELFETRRFDVVLCASPPQPLVILQGPGVDEILPGSAVRAGIRFLGRVISVGGGVAQVAPLRDARRRLGVVLVPEQGPPCRAEIRWEGSRRWRVVRQVSTVGAASGAVIVVTAGGDQLITPGLLVACGTCRGDSLELDGLPPWPSRVEVDRFRYGAERGDLLRGWRR